VKRNPGISFAVYPGFRVAQSGLQFATMATVHETDLPAGHRFPVTRAVMRWLLAALFVAAGVGHLMVPGELLKITPDWVPFAPQVIFVTGLCEFAGALALVMNDMWSMIFSENRRPFFGIMLGPLRYWAGIALAVYAVCVWPANFKHAFEGVDIPHLTSSWWYHGPRLALQPVIVWWALFCSGVIDWPWRRHSPD
jgi:uncharacterized membrane protein